MNSKAAEFFSAKRAAAGARRIGHIAISDTGDPLWVESVPEERGRFRLCRMQNGVVSEVSPAGTNVRSRFREYGGGEFVEERGIIVFALADGRLAWLEKDETRIVPTENRRYRYGDFALLADRRSVIAVEEELDELGTGHRERMVMLSLESGARWVLWDGADFVGAPRIDASHTKLVWKSWSKPNMPWDQSTLWTGVLGDKGLHSVKEIYAIQGRSVCQAEWGADGVLRAIVEPDDHWELARYEHDQWRQCAGGGVEWGRPEWVPGLRTFGFCETGKVVASVCDHGEWKIVEYREGSSTVHECGVPFTEVQNIAVSGEFLLIVGGGSDHVQSLHLFERRLDKYVLIWSRDSTTVGETISRPRLVDYTASGGIKLNAWLYLPQEGRVKRPPVIVRVHGGPTGCAQSALDFRYQFWTSRGFAIVDVNYRGSSGFGRRVRDSLYGRAGENEVEDCEALLRELEGLGLVARDNCFISGSSAGGFIALAASMRSDLFRGAAVYYGISDVEQLVQVTPPFERGYLERLFGSPDRWRRVSPGLSEEVPKCAVLLIHGDEDRIVPIEQSRRMAERIRGAGGEVECIELQGEGHGVREAGNVERCLTSEHHFFSSQRIRDVG